MKTRIKYYVSQSPFLLWIVRLSKIKSSLYLYSGIGDNKSARAVIYQFSTGGGAEQEQKYNEGNFHLQPNSFQKLQKVWKQADWSLLNVSVHATGPRRNWPKLRVIACNGQFTYAFTDAAIRLSSSYGRLLINEELRTTINQLIFERNHQRKQARKQSEHGNTSP